MTSASFNPHYMLATGDADHERLDILAEIYDASSHAFLSDILCGAVRSVVDVGCGHGGMVRRFSRMLEPGTDVVGLDCCSQQIAFCEASRVHPEPVRLEFWHADIAQSRLWRRTFDLVYGRLVLLHIADWQTSLTNIRSLCRLGGHIVLEEPAFPFFTYPESARLQRANDLGVKLAAMRQLRFDCAPHLWSRLQTLGLEVHDVRFYQPALVTERQKMLLYHSFIQIREPLMAAGLAGENEIDDIAREMLVIARDSRYIAGGLRMMQVHLRNTGKRNP
ncbi:class I SAM-dependent methyltransferase [Burkholderia ambifaria]|uniref:class I SAM-dependent methyltransferase n=1 Tax=Burkholderia ambifaria TaxID=152480 RepID=UPI001591169D|nr:class I SAM-dependent methyltransferase [Burkholderia ambifaria]